jgi:hypothetical protein
MFLQKTLFVILNAVKDLLFTMLLRPAQSANRSFTAFRMTNFSNVISLSVAPEILKLPMTIFQQNTFCHPERSEGSVIHHASSPYTVCE